MAKPLADKTSKRSIKYIEPGFKLHSFATEICETKVLVNIIKMDNSLYVWIGNEKEPVFSDLSIALKSSDKMETLATKLIGPALDTASLNLATRLAKKLNKQVFVSCNLQMDRFTLPEIEKCINIEIKENQQAF